MEKQDTFRVVVLIPAYKPDERLIQLTRELKEEKLDVLLVDDGGQKPFAPIFEKCRALGAEIAVHAVNQGKGRALKTGLNAALNIWPDLSGVVTADADGQHILCSELPPIYTYDVFDVIVDLLKTQPNYRADKGSARGHRLGEAGCEENTVAGAILKNYFGKSAGESGVDPVFVLAAVLEWAGIAHNRRGYLELTAAYSKGV